MAKCKPATGATGRIVFPVPVLIDTREQHPYAFASVTVDKAKGGGLYAIEAKRATLKSGDYSLDGYADRLAIERKSLADLYHTLGQGRDRFERELVRLNAMESARVIVEAEWSAILGDPPDRSKLRPKSVYRSILAWMERYPRVHWVMCPGREFAEVTTFRMLQRFLCERTLDNENFDPDAFLA